MGFTFYEGIDEYDKENYCSLEANDIHRYVGYGKTKLEARQNLIETLKSHKRYIDIVIEKINNASDKDSLNEIDA